MTTKQMRADNKALQSTAATGIKSNFTLPFFYFENGVCKVISSEGRPLKDGWTGVAAGKSVYDLWFIGREDGERSFNKLQATLRVDAEIEAIRRFDAGGRLKLKATA